MTDRTFNLLMYSLTPITLAVGLLLLYLLVGDHPWFGYMAGGYTFLLVILYFVKLSLFKRFMRRDAPVKTERKDG